MGSLEETIEERNFKKVKEYLQEKGRAPSIIVSEDTGVPMETIDRFLRQGRIEIPEGEEIYIPCERCGAAIRYGRFCPNCATEIARELHGALTFGEIGEEPKAMVGKMRYFDAETRKNKELKIRKVTG